MFFFALLLWFLPFASLIVPALSKPKPVVYPGLDWFYPPLPLGVKVVHQFPPGTWVENLAVRHNGKILVTRLSSPELLQVDNRGRQPPKVVHTFPNCTSLTGITHFGKDVFYVVTGNFSLSTFKAVPGSWSVWKVDVRHRHPHITKEKPARVSLVANFPDAIMLNGISRLNRHKKWLYVSDSGAGVVYRLKAKTGKIDTILDDELMKPGPSAYGDHINGVNGIHTESDQLFFSNMYRGILARIPIELDGSSRSKARKVADVEGVDDFIFNESHNVVAAQNIINRLGRVTGHEAVTMAGGPLNGTQAKLYGPTAVQFGKVRPFFDATKADWMFAYISTNGGSSQYLTGNFTRGGTVSVVDVRGYW
ncbi:hypothetical protein MMC07_004705 [Pseudocyphellaria aurata]|nr:hypothetical protein [Pseudocyphellaria aurata]